MTEAHGLNLGSRALGRRTLLLGAGATALGAPLAANLLSPAYALTSAAINQNLFGLWYKTSSSTSVTTSVVQAFQRDNNLIADGDPGPITQMHLTLVVQKVQRKVGVTADGEYGPITTNAVRAWQNRVLGYGQGQAGPDTMKNMRIQRDLSVSAVGGTVSADEIISRGRTWTDQRLPYSMYSTHPDAQGRAYRSDCSGFVSMAWHLSSSLSTVTLPGVATQISKASLRRGDAIGNLGAGTAGAAGHVLLFDGWTSSSQTYYYGLEEAGSRGAIRRQIQYPYGADSRYKPYRYSRSVASIF